MLAPFAIALALGCTEASSSTPAPESPAPVPAAARELPRLPPIAEASAAASTVYVEQLASTLWRTDRDALTEIALDAASGRLGCTPIATGCELTELAQGSIVDRLGLRRGDRITSVAGVAIADGPSLREAVMAAGVQGMFEVEIVRGAATLHHRYRLRERPLPRARAEAREKLLDLLGLTIQPADDGVLRVDAASGEVLGQLLGRNDAGVLAGLLGHPGLELGAVDVEGESVVDPELAFAQLALTITAEREAVVQLVDRSKPDEPTVVRARGVRGLVEPSIVALAKALLDDAGSAPATAAPTTVEPVAMDGVKAVDDTTFEVKRSVIAPMLDEPEVWIRTARIVPARDGGMKVYGMRSTSLLRALGLSNGDTVLSVNGRSLDTPDDAMAAWSERHTTDVFRLLVRRRATELELTIRIVP